MIGFEGKKYPSVMVQGFILATDVLYLQHCEPNIFIFISMGIVFTLFAIQAVNHRFFYYFPRNKFTMTMTYNIDTYILFVMTFFAIFFMLSGIFSITLAIIGAIIICSSPFLWRYFGYPWTRDLITKRLMGKIYTSNEICPCCGGRLVIKRKVLAWNRGVEYYKCLEECGKEGGRIVKLNIG